MIPTDLICYSCNKSFKGFSFMHRNPASSLEILCSECLEGKTDKARAKWLKERRGTIEERLDWIEGYIYEIESASNRISADILNSREGDNEV